MWPCLLFDIDAVDGERRWHDRGVLSNPPMEQHQHRERSLAHLPRASAPVLVAEPHRDAPYRPCSPVRGDRFKMYGNVQARHPQSPREWNSRPAIVEPALHPSIGANTQGPSLVRMPDWVESPLGRYYPYFADHKGRYIRLAYADDLAILGGYIPPGSLRLGTRRFRTSLQIRWSLFALLAREDEPR